MLQKSLFLEREWLTVFLILSLKHALRPKAKIHRQEVAWVDSVRTETEKNASQSILRTTSALKIYNLVSYYHWVRDGLMFYTKSVSGCWGGGFQWFLMRQNIVLSAISVVKAMLKWVNFKLSQQKVQFGGCACKSRELTWHEGRLPSYCMLGWEPRESCENANGPCVTAVEAELKPVQCAFWMCYHK